MGVCTNIKVVTAAYGYENSWTFGSCSSNGQSYGDNQEFDLECCQPVGSYNLICDCSYGDGWHGGYIQIGGSDVRHCEDFQTGYFQVVEDVAQGNPSIGNAPGDNVCTNIKVVTAAYGYENSWTFGSCSSNGQSYGDNQEYDLGCCQSVGSYNLICDCSYGDGWHGGYIQIGGSDIRHCENFQTGYSQVVEDVAQGNPSIGNAPGDNVCTNIKV